MAKGRPRTVTPPERRLSDAEKDLMLKMSEEGFQAIQIARALGRDERHVRRLLKASGIELRRHQIPFGGDRLLKLLQRYHGEHYVRSPER